MKSSGTGAKPARLRQSGGGAAKAVRVWVERVMIPYNFAVFESKRAVFSPLRPRFLRVRSDPPTP
ncbi:putative aspartyl/glutamyl-tRNA(Asn/Gln) amidotransferase, C subunit [Burkholderia thailandensis]|nr:putative aspartyl/glutamyl-tRNA(Asn/Gln) amidotransferase, C subunit [Burkholderia thailandensis]